MRNVFNYSIKRVTSEIRTLIDHYWPSDRLSDAFVSASLEWLETAGALGVAPLGCTPSEPAEKNRGGFVFDGNFGSSADIILRFIASWLIRHSTGRGAEEYAGTLPVEV